MDNNYNSYNYNSVKNSVRHRTAARKRAVRGSRTGLRLGVCIGIFALAVCLRVASPGFAEGLSERVLGVMDSSVDYRAAFAAVGSFVSGESTLGETVAVLKSSGAEKAEPVSSVRAEPSGAAENNLQESYLRCLEVGLERQSEAASASVSVADNVVIYEQSPELPENVCAEQVKLPFECTRPVPGECSSDFGYRLHPIDNVDKFHYGMDFAAGEGDDIHAFADGHVAASGVSETAGKYLIISHGDGWTTQYFHCSKVYATGGSAVKRGEVVAAAGQTGAATGPHLHFELICDGVYHDPGLYIDEQS